MASERHVVVVAFEDMQLLDLAGPVEVLNTANRLGAAPGYRVTIATPSGQPVRTFSGVEVGADTDLRSMARRGGAVDTLLVVGGIGTRSLMRDKTALAGVRRLSARARRTTSVCTGSLVLAAAGLLDGYTATTHWSACDLLSEFEEVTVAADRIFVVDRDRWTSAGVTAGIDLFLAIVEADHGPALAHAVAGQLVVFVRRPGGQSQFSAQMQTAPAAAPSIAEVQRWLPDHLGDDLTVEALAARAGMSPRTFARAFRRETGTTPAAFVESLRVEAARRLLETSDLTVRAIANQVGMQHAETLHRAFKRSVGTTPDSYRQHFNRKAS